MQHSVAVADNDGPAQHQRRGQAAVLQAVRNPEALTVGAAPCGDLAIRFGADDTLCVAMNTFIAVRSLRPHQVATGGVDTTHIGLKRPGADHVADAAHTPHQINQALNVIGTTRACNRGFPANQSRVGIDSHHTASLPGHQQVTHGQYHPGLTQHQGFSRFLLNPKPTTGLTIIGTNRTVSSQYKHTPARHQRRSKCLGRELLTPEFSASIKHYQLVRRGHHSRALAVTANACRKGFTNDASPFFSACAGVHADHGAVRTGQRDAITNHIDIQRKLDFTQPRAPDLLDTDQRDVRR